MWYIHVSDERCTGVRCPSTRPSHMGKGSVMSTAYLRYLREMNLHFGYLATWQPGLPLALGDVGIIDGGVFRRVTTLQALGIPVLIRADESPGDLTYESSSGISMQVKAAGEPSPIGSALLQARAGITFNFTETGAVVFAAVGARSPTLGNLAEIEHAILRLRQSKQWNNRWTIITEVVATQSATVLISTSKSGKVELTVGGNLPIGGVNLADASLALSVSSSRNVGIRIVCQSSLTPLYQAVKLEGVFHPTLERRSGLRSATRGGMLTRNLAQHRSQRLTPVDVTTILARSVGTSPPATSTTNA